MASTLNKQLIYDYDIDYAALKQPRPENKQSLKGTRPLSGTSVRKGTQPFTAPVPEAKKGTRPLEDNLPGFRKATSNLNDSYRKVRKSTQPLVDVLPELQPEQTARIKKATQPLVEPVIFPAVKREKPRFSLALIGAAFFLLAAEAVIYFHSVQVEIGANRMQKEIIDMKEMNYSLKVELEKAKELTVVEAAAQKQLKMKPIANAEINYLAMPEQKMAKEYLITRVAPAEKKVNILIGY